MHGLDCEREGRSNGAIGRTGEKRMIRLVIITKSSRGETGAMRCAWSEAEEERLQYAGVAEEKLARK